MSLKTLFISCSLIALSISAVGGNRPYEYVLDQPKWEQERAEARIELRTAWACLTGRQSAYALPDSVLSDSEECYYTDAKGNTVEVLGSVFANNGQPYSISPYHYIDSDGMVTFNTRQWIEMVLWCLNVLVSPWLWFTLLACLIYLGVLLKERVHN